MQPHNNNPAHSPGSAFAAREAGSKLPAQYRRRAVAGALLAFLGLLLWPWAAGATVPVVPGSAAVPAPPLSPTATVCPLYFMDVPGSNPFYGPIIYLACQGVVSGYQDATFRPNGTITRGQISKMVVLAAGISDVIPSDQQTFADVPPSQPFWLFVERLAGRGYVSGYTCGGPGEPCPGTYFRPNANITRGQIAKIDANAAPYSENIPSTQQTFEDVPHSNPFWLFSERVSLHGVISGYGCGGPGEPCNPPTNRPYFRPYANATRGQAAKIVANTFFPGYAPPPAQPMLRLGRGQDPFSLLPYLDNTGANFQHMVFNSLVRRDQSEQVLPDLASSVPTLANGDAVYVGTGDNQRLRVTYHLRTGVHWYDGVEFTAQDVLFTYNLVLNPQFPVNSRQGLQKYASVSAPDAYTVVFNYLTWPEAAALIAQDPATYGFLQRYVDAHVPVTDPEYNENFGLILPEHLLAAIPPDQLPASAYAAAPWGTGPYYVTHFIPGVIIQLEPNPNYNVTPNPPAIPHIASPLYTNSQQLPIGVTSAALDATTSESLIPEQLPALKDLETQGLLVLANKESNGYEHIDFETQREPFTDVRLRQAVAYALDRNAINQALFASQLTLPGSWIMPHNWASIENPVNIAQYPGIVSQFRHYPYDPAQANALLDAAGWPVGNDGIRVKNGQRLAITWLTTTKAYRRSIATLQQNMLRAVGIDSVPNVIPSSQLFAPPPDGPLYSGSYGDYGLAMFAYRGSDEPISSIYTCAEVPSPANGYAGSNDLFWCNAQFDQLAAAAALGLDHDPARVQELLQMQVIFSQEVPSIPLLALPSLAVYSPHLHNFQMSADGLLLNVHEWTVDPQAQR